MFHEESIRRVAALLRTVSEDVERLGQLMPGQEASRATQNVRASLDALRRELLPLVAQDGVDVGPLLEIDSLTALKREEAIPQTER